MTTTERWVALLRAVNVAGKNKIAMADMRELMTDLGFADAQTYLQSGNVIFDADAASSGDDLGRRIAEGVADRFGHQISVMMRTTPELQALVDGLPWELAAPTSTGVVFFDRAIDAEVDASAFYPDECVVAGRDIYVECPTGFGKTKLTVAWLERQTGAIGTRRNWKTLRRLAAG